MRGVRTHTLSIGTDLRAPQPGSAAIKTNIGGKLRRVCLEHSVSVCEGVCPDAECHSPKPLQVVGAEDVVFLP
jgi:hypothetical protein